VEYFKANKEKRWFTMYALLIVLMALLFAPWLVRGMVLAPLDIVGEMYLPWRGDTKHPEVHNHFVTDAATQYFPYQIIAARAFEEEGYLGWNPLMFGGTSQAANTMALSSDWGTQLHRFLSFWTAWHLSVLGRFLIAGLGMLVFLRSRGCRPGLATALAAAYMLNTEFVNWIYHQWAVASFCWMPWVLWALYRAREKSPRFLAPAAVFLGLSVMGSTLQHAAFIVIALGCLWVGWLVEGKGALPLARSGLPSRWRDTATIATAGLLGAGLAAFVLEPAIAGYLENLRSGHTRKGIGYAFGLSQPLRTLMAWPLTFYPFVLGSVQTLDLTKAFVPSGLTFAFFGTVPMLLAVIGFFSKRVPLEAKLLIVAGLAIPLTPLVGVLYQRVSLVWILGGCWVAGVWVSTATERELKKLCWWCWRLLAGVIILWVAVSTGIVVFRGDLEAALSTRIAAAAGNSQFGIFTDWLEQRGAGLLDYLCIWNPWQMLGLAGLGISLWGLLRCRSTALWPGMALAVGVAMQLSVFWWQWTTWTDNREVYADSELARLLQQEVGTTGRLAQGAGRPAEILFPPNTLMPLGVAITGGYDSIHPDGMRSPTGKPWDFPGTTHYLGEAADEQPVGWHEVWSDGRWNLLRNPAPKPGMVTLESGLPVPLRPDDFKRATMNTMQATIPDGAVKLEIFSNWHRGWKWRDDLEEKWSDTVASPAKGVEVRFEQPLAQKKIVYLQFDPSPPQWVFVITALSALALIALALSSGPQDRKDPD
jgi:hypothetical protein